MYDLVDTEWEDSFKDYVIDHIPITVTKVNVTFGPWTGRFKMPSEPIIPVFAENPMTAKEKFILLETGLTGFMRAHNMGTVPPPETRMRRVYDKLEVARNQMLSEIRQMQIEEKNEELFKEQ